VMFLKFLKIYLSRDIYLVIQQTDQCINTRALSFKRHPFTFFFYLQKLNTRAFLFLFLLLLLLLCISETFSFYFLFKGFFVSEDKFYIIRGQGLIYMNMQSSHHSTFSHIPRYNDFLFIFFFLLHFLIYTLIFSIKNR